MDRMYQVDNDVVLVNTNAIEVFPHSLRELLLRLPLLTLSTRHSGRLETDASSPLENEVVVGLGEGRGSVEVIFAAVGMEGLAVDGVPLDLDEAMGR